MSDVAGEGTVVVEWALVMGVIGCHGEEGNVDDVGVGVGAPVVNDEGVEASGSMNEKKLCERECLW